jgi:GT2 family glycosyltransferase
MKTIACVVPTHGRHDYLELALNSIEHQTRTPDEVLVVSDVADPVARDLCERIGQRGILHLTYVESGDGENGASSSRNVGTRASTTDLIAYLDDDDLWEAKYLESVLNVADGADMIVTWLDEFGDGHSRPGPRMREGMRGQDVAAINPGATGSNIVVSRLLFERIDGFDTDLPVKNDTDFVYRALRAGAQYRVVDQPLVRQRKHSLGQLTARTERRALGTERYMTKHSMSLTAEDMRLMKQQVERIRSHSGKNKFSRTFHRLMMVRYYSRADFARVLIRGRDRSHAKVAAFEENAG